MSDAKLQETVTKSSTSVSIDSRRTVPQMFGIYRARTPDAKLDDTAPPGRHTRALFLTAVVTGVALVVGLTLLDVSTNSSNLKSTPVLHLTRHRQDLFVVDAKTTESPDVLGIVEEINDTTSETPVTSVLDITEIVGLTLLDVSTNSSNLKSTPVLHLTRHRQDLFVVDAKTTESPDVLGIVEEINDTTSETPVTSVLDITEIVTTEEVNEEEEKESNKDPDKVRTARTQLFPIESLKRHRTQYLKDYFVDGKHDPQSIGYYILQKQNGEYYLRNYSEPMWGTRIRRRFSNRMYPPPSLGSDPFQFARRSDTFDVRFPNYGVPPRIDPVRNYPIDRQDHGRKNLHTMTTLRKYFNPYSKRVDTGLSQSYSNFDHPFAPTPSTDSKEKDSLDPSSYYQFTPIPVFSDAYAQLDPYKNNREIKSIKDIVKYLTTSTSAPRVGRTTTQATITSLESFQSDPEKTTDEEDLEDLLTTSSAEKVTRLKPPSNANFNWKDTTYRPPLPPRRINRKRGMRISGTYRMPIEPEDLRTGASGLVETLVPPPMHPFMYIANTTEPDPLAKFRPLDPSEINQLAAPKPSKPPGSMFMNNIRPKPTTPNQFFPKPPHDRSPTRHGISLNPNHSPSHTVALFKQNGSSGRQKYLQSNSGRKKPVSVTLDIYPMTVNNEQGYQQDEGTGLPSKYDDKPFNEEWSPRNPDTTNQQMDSQGSDNHMVVHLNVYPKGITSNLRSGIGRQAFWNPPLPVAAYQKRAMSDNLPANTTESPTKNPEKEIINSTVIEDAILDSPFSEYDFDDFPASSYDVEGTDSGRSNSTNNGNATSTRTKEEDNWKDNGNSISSQRDDTASNKTDNNREEFAVNDEEKNHETESFSLESGKQSRDSSLGNNTPSKPPSVDFSMDLTQLNASQLNQDQVAVLENDKNSVKSSTSESSRYQYRVLQANASNYDSVSDYNQVKSDSSIEVVKNYDNSNHKLENDTEFSGLLRDYYQQDWEGENYDYDADNAPEDYKDYFPDENSDGNV